jgi:hypothetical protein
MMNDTHDDLGLTPDRSTATSDVIGPSVERRDASGVKPRSPGGWRSAAAQSIIIEARRFVLLGHVI